MPEFSKLSWFIGAAIIVLLTPGPAVLYIVARSLDQGRLIRPHADQVTEPASTAALN